MKRIYETAAAKSLSAWVILDRKGRHVSTVRAHYGNSLVRVEVCNKGDDIQFGNAGGYGYDKFSAALRGLIVAGHTMTDHCEGSKKVPASGWPSSAKVPKGWRFSNYNDGAYRNCYREAGLDYLKALGFQVIQAI